MKEKPDVRRILEEHGFEQQGLYHATRSAGGYVLIVHIDYFRYKDGSDAARWTLSYQGKRVPGGFSPYINTEHLPSMLETALEKLASRLKLSDL